MRASLAFERFVVATNALERRHGVIVHVYDTLEELRTAATNYGGADYSTAAGVCHGFGFTTGRAPQLMALVRLCRGHVSSEVVVHEMAHAAAHVYGAGALRPYSRALPHMNAGNERFAYVASDLTVAVFAQLRRRGYWD